MIMVMVIMMMTIMMVMMMIMMMMMVMVMMVMMVMMMVVMMMMIIVMMVIRRTYPLILKFFVIKDKNDTTSTTTSSYASRRRLRDEADTSSTTRDTTTSRTSSSYLRSTSADNVSSRISEREKERQREAEKEKVRVSQGSILAPPPSIALGSGHYLWRGHPRKEIFFLVKILPIQPLKRQKQFSPNLKYQSQNNYPPLVKNFTKEYNSVVTHVLYHFCDTSLITACAIFCSLKFHVVCTCTFFRDTICLVTNRKIQFSMIFQIRLKNNTVNFRVICPLKFAVKFRPQDPLIR